MRVFAIIIGLTILIVAVVLTVVPLVAMRDAIFALCILVPAGFRLLLMRVAPQWSNARAVLLAAAALPALCWLLAFGFDLSVVIQRMLEPGKSLMGGMTIILLGPCFFGFLAGLLAALVTGAVARRLRQR